MMRQAPIPRLSLAIVRGDQIVYQQGCGTANRADLTIFLLGIAMPSGCTA